MGVYYVLQRSTHLSPFAGSPQEHTVYISGPCQFLSAVLWNFSPPFESEKVTTLSFLGYVMHAKPPLSLGKVLKLALNPFYHPFEA